MFYSSSTSTKLQNYSINKNENIRSVSKMLPKKLVVKATLCRWTYNMKFDAFNYRYYYLHATK